MITTLIKSLDCFNEFHFFQFSSRFLDSSHYFYNYFVTICALKFLNSMCFSFCESPVENFHTTFARVCIN